NRTGAAGRPRDQQSRRDLPALAVDDEQDDGQERTGRNGCGPQAAVELAGERSEATVELGGKRAQAAVKFDHGPRLLGAGSGLGCRTDRAQGISPEWATGTIGPWYYRSTSRPPSALPPPAAARPPSRDPERP